MKATAVSSAAISNALRYQQARMQADLVKATKESSTGKVADVGLALGGRTTQAVTFQRDLDRLNGIVDSNALVAARLTSTQDSLGQIADTAQSFLSALTSGVSGDSSTGILQTAGASALQQMTGILNTSVNGEYLFAGTNTDVKPIDDFSAAGSPAKAAFDAAFTSYFGFAQTDPAAANITAAQMDDFITTKVEPQFLGAGWQANWSSATNDQITSRISLNETTQTSVSANEQGIRKLAMAAARGEIRPEAIDADLFAGTLDTAGIPDPELVIRTSGELRLSNFLLWQAAYSELAFLPCYWPDFSREHLAEVLLDFAGRERRFGGLAPQDIAL